jgi:hypothetical protein
MDNNQLLESTIKPNKLPSFMNYIGTYFDYNGRLEEFHNIFKKVTIDLRHYYEYDANKFSYEVITYHNNCEIKYVVDIYKNRKGEGYTIESRRLNGYGFYYIKEIYNLWINLNEFGLVFDETFSEYKENSSLKNRIPNLPIQTLNEDQSQNVNDDKLGNKNINWGDQSGCSLFVSEEVSKKDEKEEELNSIKNKLKSEHVDDKQYGLYFLINIINHPEFTEYLKKSKFISQVLDIFCNFKGRSPNRLFLVVIGEAIDSYHEEIMKNNLILDYIYTRLNNIIEDNNINNMYLCEGERQSILILKKLYYLNNGIYIKVLKEKNYTPILSKLIEVTDHEIIKGIAEEVHELLK